MIFDFGVGASRQVMMEERYHHSAQNWRKREPDYKLGLHSRVFNAPKITQRASNRMKMQQKNNSGLGLGIACTQRINSGRWSNAYIACDSTGRLMEQSGNGHASRMAARSYGRHPCSDTPCW